MNEEPLVSVVRGSLDDHEVAALAAILASRSTSVNCPTPPQPTSDWLRSARPGAPFRNWQTSARPGIR
ncbi:acyl-CoA carboxylase subunit epsilon [Actinoplanes philippinensis]|uniref:acyl-CoA carboxylase subunit epsilon n=1 Tax=Actinoplanes philippinensis TaxID=35752 RepID=UPI000B832642|nr:acyl-CoA carboxylase subunit epsilon [Actinoplanes philippinensis]